jgi:hypothetical protein
MGQVIPFTTVADCSTLTSPRGGENKRVICKVTATIIFYLLPHTSLALRYVNALDSPRPATLLRVIKPRGNRAGEAQIPVVITYLTAYIWCISRLPCPWAFATQSMTRTLNNPVTHRLNGFPTTSSGRPATIYLTFNTSFRHCWTVTQSSCQNAWTCLGTRRNLYLHQWTRHRLQDYI